MLPRMRWCLLSLAVLASTPLCAQNDLSKQPIVFRSGAWSVRRAADPMTDRGSCTGVGAGSDFRYQLNEGAFYIAERGRGGVQSVTVRFDNEPPQEMRLATDTEKELGVVVLQGGEFAHLLKATRLRVSVFSVLETVLAEDIDLHGLAAAYRFITTDPRCH